MIYHTIKCNLNGTNKWYSLVSRLQISEPPALLGINVSIFIIFPQYNDTYIPLCQLYHFVWNNSKCVLMFRFLLASLKGSRPCLDGGFIAKAHILKDIRTHNGKWRLRTHQRTKNLHFHERKLILSGASQKPYCVIIMNHFWFKTMITINHDHNHCHICNTNNHCYCYCLCSPWNNPHFPWFQPSVPGSFCLMFNGTVRASRGIFETLAGKGHWVCKKITVSMGQLWLLPIEYNMIPPSWKLVYNPVNYRYIVICVLYCKF